MIFYLLLFSIPAIVHFTPIRNKELQNIFLYGFFILGTLIIGFRHEVGGDWFEYLADYSKIGNMAFFDAIWSTDPAYGLINWISFQSGFSIKLVNIFCALFFMFGLVMFSKNQKYPWLALTISIPYFFIVVGMGLTRQAVAVALVMLAFTQIVKNKKITYVAIVLFAATFHKTAIVMLPLVAVFFDRLKLDTLIYTILITFLAGFIFIYEELNTLWSAYIEDARYVSGGAVVRIFLNSLPLFVSIFYFKSVYRGDLNSRLFFWLGLGSLSCIPLLMLSSTLADRAALYFSPIQFGLWPLIVSAQPSKLMKITWSMGLIFFYSIILVYWMGFSQYSWAWVPYRIY